MALSQDDNMLMPYSPLDALLNCLPDLRKAGRARFKDTASDVDARMADVLRPIVIRIEQEAKKDHVAALESISSLWPEPPNCADMLEVGGINDGRGRAILLYAAINIARKALGRSA